MYKTAKVQCGPGADSSSEFFTMAYDHGWTDGLPVIPPTVERVDELLAAVDRNPDEVISVMPPRKGAATVQGIAVNAVMAGCLPEYFPVVLAAIEAITDRMFPLSSLANLRPETPFFMVNGPICEKIGLESGRGCLGPGRRANATIGRAVRLAMINLGGMTPGGYARACFSSPLQYTFCAAEDEANSVWEPFHVERGFKKEQSVISAFRVTSYIALLVPLDWDQSPRGLLEQTARSMVSLGNTSMYAGNTSCLLLLNAERAQLLADAGISKAEAKAMIYDYTLLPESYFKNTDVLALRKKGRIAGNMVSLVDSPDEIHIGVMGGAGIHSVFLPGFSHENVPRAPISKLIAEKNT